jgi:hypothetical protein
MKRARKQCDCLHVAGVLPAAAARRRHERQRQQNEQHCHGNQQEHRRRRRERREDERQDHQRRGDAHEQQGRHREALGPEARALASRLMIRLILCVGSHRPIVRRGARRRRASASAALHVSGCHRRFAVETMTSTVDQFQLGVLRLWGLISWAHEHEVRSTDAALPFADVLLKSKKVRM